MGVGPTHMRASAKTNTLLGEVHIHEEASKDLVGRVVSLRGMQNRKLENPKAIQSVKYYPLLKRLRNGRRKLHHQQRMHNQAVSQR
jgi:hypothetical protein